MIGVKHRLGTKQRAERLDKCLRLLPAPLWSPEMERLKAMIKHAIQGIELPGFGRRRRDNDQFHRFRAPSERVPWLGPQNSKTLTEPGGEELIWEGLLVPHIIH